MGEFIRRLLRWIIFIIVVVLLILLIVKLANKNGTAKKTKKVINSGVETIKKEKDKFSNKKNNNTKTETKEETNTNNNNDNNIVTSTLEVNTPDTGTSSYLYILGIVVLSGGTYYIYKNRELND